MNCPDWEEQIASEIQSAGLDEHLQGCERCREFAREIEENRKALAEVVIPAPAFDAVRLRVRSEIQARKRRKVLWACFGGAMAASYALLLLSMLAPRLPSRSVLKPPHIAAVPPKIERAPVHVPVVARAHHIRRTHSGRLAAKAAPAQQRDPLVVKMLTDDPNVIIIWLVNEKGD